MRPEKPPRLDQGQKSDAKSTVIRGIGDNPSGTRNFLPQSDWNRPGAVLVQ